MSMFQRHREKKLNKTNELLNSYQEVLTLLKEIRPKVDDMYLGARADLDIALVERNILKFEAQKAKLELKLGVRKE